MRILNFIADTDNITVKSVLKNEFNLAASVITALKNTCGILVNSENVTVRKLMQKGDELKLIIPDTPSDAIVKTKGTLHVLYEDEDILCVNKPSGMPTHPSQNHYTDTLANLVCYYYMDVPFTFRVSNRLDSYTSGVVVIAKNMYSASFLCTEEFRKNMTKTYYALCRGIFENKKGTVSAPIGRSSGSTIKREINPNGKYASTDYEVAGEKNGNSLVKLNLHTGRTHQIRVHMAYLGHPLLDDFLYDDYADINKHFFLHCQKISFIHPYTKQNVIVEAPMTDINSNF